MRTELSVPLDVTEKTWVGELVVAETRAAIGVAGVDGVDVAASQEPGCLSHSPFLMTTHQT